MALPLEGIRVLDFTQIFAGPGTGMYLADQGAEVIKIEPPDGGRDRPEGQARASFLVLNRSKKSIVLDIRPPEGREIVHRLVKTADVMLVAWPPGQAERLGCGYEAMQELNPRLVYASITGWGNRGPHAMDRGYDRMMQAYTGVMASRPAPDGTPLDTSFFVADMSIPMYLCYGIMLALWMREKTGRGQKVGTSQLEAQIAMQSIYLVHAEKGVPDYLGGGTTYRPSHTYRCQDGRYVVLVPLTEGEWQALWQVLGLAEFASDPNLRSQTGRSGQIERIYPAVADRFLAKPSQEWSEILGTAGVPHALVLTREEFMRESHPWENKMLMELEDPNWGRTVMMSIPFQLSEHLGKVRGPAPAFGEHTEEILKELGYNPQEIAGLKEKRVVISATSPELPQ